MGTTPTLALPYPEASDPADVPTDIHELATALDTLVHKTTYGTTPPASPNDGDEWILPADATAGVIWRFRYRAASASAYKWEFVGGPPAVQYISTSEQAVTGAWGDLPTVGPSLTTPRAGDYIVDFDATATANGTTWAHVGISVGGAPPGLEVMVAFSSASQYGTTGGIRRLNGVAAATLIKLQYFPAAGTMSFLYRNLAVTPVRVS